MNYGILDSDPWDAFIKRVREYIDSGGLETEETELQIEDRKKASLSPGGRAFRFSSTG